MKLFKKVVSIVTMLSIMAVTLSCMSVLSVSAETTAEYEVGEQITLNFNTSGKGWSDTNGPSYLTQVADPDNSSNKYMELYTPNGNGYNMELASSDSSNTAYTLTANTKYSITITFKPLDSNSGNLALFIGGKAASATGYSKYLLKSWTAASNPTGSWHTVTHEFTTNDTMTYNSYNGSGNTNLCDRLYLVAHGTENTWAIDKVVITKYVLSTGPKNQITYINFNNDGKGWSDTNGTAYVKQVTDPNNSSNKYLELSSPNGDGYNIELASGSNSNSAYILEPSTQYTLTFKYKATDSIDSNLVLLIGSVSAHVSSKPKYGPLKSWNAASASDGQWKTATYTFTTTDSMTYASYKGSGSTAICDKIYLVARSNKNTWAIDDIEIKKHVPGANGDIYVDGIKPEDNTGGDSGDDNTGDQPEEEKQVYTIPDFNHEPYKTYAAPGMHSGVWYCSVRWSTYNDNGNSVMRFKYAYDISENAPSTSGSRGVNAMGTNGGQHAMMCLVDDDNPSVPIKVTQGKSYRITFKYKVTNVELNSFVSFNIMRGQYKSGWTGSSGIGSATNKDDDRYIIVIEYAPTNGWVEASYTFTADYSTNPERDVMQIGGAGYGDALIDDIVITEIDASEVEPVNNDAAKYDYKITGDSSSINSYKGKDENLTITTLIGRRKLAAINEYAFLYNRYTKNIVIEDGPVTIDRFAFEYAKVLETISIPKSVTTIGDRAFYGIKTMKSFTVDANNPNFASVDGVLYTKDMKTLLYYPAAKDGTTFNIPATVTTIAEGAFANATKLETVVLPDGLATIERRAFLNCSKLKATDIPDNTSIDASAFSGCTSAYSIGNVNTASDTIDPSDSAFLSRHLANWDGYKLDHFQKLASDVNKDGVIDVLDDAILARHLANWDGYKNIPYTSIEDVTYDEYVSDSTIPELVVNLTEKNTNKVTPNRDIVYDENKEDVIIILITGQSNSGTGGYSQEYEYKYTTNYGGTTHPNWEITAEPVRPDEGTVFFGAIVTELNSNNDVYFKTDTAKGASTMGGYSPAMGKALHDATGAKIVFVQASKGAVGMHEWTPEPEKYNCACGENGGGKLYSNAIANFTKTYQALEDDYNIIATAYVYNQGEHEEHSPYADKSTCTVHDDQTYYDALLSMHYGFLTECEIDCGGVFLPRSWVNRYTDTESGLTDNKENSRRPSIARAAQYAAAQNVANFFIFSNVSEEICKEGPLKPDPSNTIHYGQAAYNAIGAQNADSLAKYFGFTDASEFTGITVFNKKGIELCKFDANGNLVSGSDVLEFSADNSKLYIRIDPTGTMYTLNYSCAGTSVDFVDEFCNITSINGQTSFKIVINTPREVITNTNGLSIERPFHA